MDAAEATQSLESCAIFARAGVKPEAADLVQLTATLKYLKDQPDGPGPTPSP